ncbi:hypothetical protein LSH36_261g03016 [Paralvinella palmiformis]|uniref:Uncharacterized protein n=1 Tax=Paralvinella palmiformis TaxID=53620 RepID=A0AAD9JL52_9ANNE|nr:hypothetical protein LSH36_261g03016 [Paralvinella palmiformis]
MCFSPSMMCWMFLFWLAVVSADVQFSQKSNEHNPGVSSFRFASYFTNHVVLQRAPQRPGLWGYASMDDIGKPVFVMLMSANRSRVIVSGKVHKGPFNNTAVWHVLLNPISDTIPHMIVARIPGQKPIFLRDVLFGDVWLCSGQSNMQFNVLQSIISTWASPAETFQKDLKMKSDDRAMDGFSAVCYMFGKYLYQTLGYPIGLIDSTWGGTPIESWSDREALAKCGLNNNFYPSHFEIDSIQSGWNEQYLQHVKALSAKEDELAAEILLRSDPAQMKHLGNTIHSRTWPLEMKLQHMTWALFGKFDKNSEANTHYHTDYYNCSFPTMITSWRTHFSRSTGGQVPNDMAFGFVQICCSSTYSNCPLNATTNWIASPIVKYNSTTVRLSWQKCPSGDLAAYRYAWRETPCPYHQCAIYSDLSGDPLPTFTKLLKK